MSAPENARSEEWTPERLERIERWRRHFEQHPPPPLTEEQARLLRAAFGTGSRDVR